MSIWTHINGIIEVDVFGSAQYEIEYNLKKVLEHLPVVTGSEENMHIVSVKKPGHCNTSSSTDEFGKRSNLARNGKGGLFSYQSQYILILSGDLRDRTFGRTYRELIKYLVRLGKRLMIDRMLINLEEEYGRSTIIKNEDYYDNFWRELSFEDCDTLTKKERMRYNE